MLETPLADVRPKERETRERRKERRVMDGDGSKKGGRGRGTREG